MGLFDFFKKKEIDTPDSLYHRAKALSKCLFDFPYTNPSSVPPSVREDKPLMDIIVSAHHTTIGSDGKTQQITIDSAERIRLQAEFKTRIYALLDKCLSADPEYAPAILLYPKVAEWNTRAADSAGLIELYERLLPRVDQIKKGTRAYSLIEKDIKGTGGNFYDQVERYTADFLFELGDLYLKTDQWPEAITQFEKAINLMPLLEHIYCGLSDAYVGNGQPNKALALWEKALTLPFDQTSKQAVIRPRYEDVKDAMRRPQALLVLTGKILPIIEEHPAILQKDLYKHFPPEEKSDISSIIKTLESEGLVVRKKKGGSYQLLIEEPASEVLEQAKDIEFS